MSPTTVIDERRLLANGFRLEGRNLLPGGESVWSREGVGDRTWSDSEAIRWVDQHEHDKRRQR